MTKYKKTKYDSDDLKDCNYYIDSYYIKENIFNKYKTLSQLVARLDIAVIALICVSFFPMIVGSCYNLIGDCDGDDCCKDELCWIFPGIGQCVSVTCECFCDCLKNLFSCEGCERCCKGLGKCCGKCCDNFKNCCSICSNAMNECCSDEISNLNNTNNSLQKKFSQLEKENQNLNYNLNDLKNKRNNLMYNKKQIEIVLFYLAKRGVVKNNEIWKYYPEQLLLTGNYLIVGGLGFAAMNPSFNAHQGIYGKAIDWDEEHFRCDHWRRLFSEAVDEARKYHCSLVVLTHTPVSDWCRELQDSSNIVFFNGHTHRNVAIGGENNTYIFSDNQIGYKGTHFRFKKAILHIPRNPFAADPDGYREITCDEYKEYYRFVGGVIPKTGTIEKQIKQNEAKLYIIKKDGYVGFFLGSPKGVYICNGGVPKKIGSAESLDKYYSNFSSMISKYITALSPLRHVQEQLSAYIKSFGGTGKIHGTIVDIDYQNHVMISDTLTYYNSPVFGLIKTYEDIGSLLHDHCPQLEERFIKIGNAPLIPVANELTCGTSEYEFVDIKNSPYAVSRRVNALQRLFDKRILRDWNPEMEE